MWTEKKEDGIASRPLIASRRVSAAGFEVNLMGTTLSTNQLQHKCARWLFNFVGERSAPRPVMCEGAPHPMQSRLQMLALCAQSDFFKHSRLRKCYRASHLSAPNTDRAAASHLLLWLRAAPDGNPQVPGKVTQSCRCKLYSETLQVICDIRPLHCWSVALIFGLSSADASSFEKQHEIPLRFSLLLPIWRPRLARCAQTHTCCTAARLQQHGLNNSPS